MQRFQQIYFQEISWWSISLWEDVLYHTNEQGNLKLSTIRYFTSTVMGKMKRLTSPSVGKDIKWLECQNDVSMSSCDIDQSSMNRGVSKFLSSYI